MFFCLATSLDFHVDQTFSLNILLYEQMFGRLAISANKAFHLAGALLSNQTKLNRKPIKLNPRLCVGLSLAIKRNRTVNFV